MAKKFFCRRRQIYNKDDTEGKRIVIIQTKGIKTKKKHEVENNYSSGLTEYSKSEDKTNLKLEIPSLIHLEKYILKYIIGQDAQVRKIITSIYKSLKFKALKSNILIIGKSGTGKTETIKQIAQRLHIPYTIEDATKYTQEGYYGDDAIDMVFNLLENCNYDLKRAENGIIVIDEIDKKVGEGEHDVSGVEVLKSLLKIIEGTKIKVPLNLLNPLDNRMSDFDTKKIIFIFLGAFSGLENIRKRRLNINQLGFLASEGENGKKIDRYIKRDLIEYGMPEEFVGRIDTIIEMNELSQESLALILKKSKLSILKKYQSELSEMGVSLSYDDKLYEYIAKESLSLDTGARELSNTVNYVFENIIYDIMANPKKYHQCTLDLDIVHDNFKYKLS